MTVIFVTDRRVRLVATTSQRPLRIAGGAQARPLRLDSASMLQHTGLPGDPKGSLGSSETLAQAAG